MAELYNLTNLTNSGNFLELTTATSKLTDNLWGSLALFAFFIILFVGLKGEMRIKAAAASFVTLLVAIFFRVLEFIGDWQVFLFVVLTIITVMFAMYKQE